MAHNNEATMHWHLLVCLAGSMSVKWLPPGHSMSDHLMVYGDLKDQLIRIEQNLVCRFTICPNTKYHIFAKSDIGSWRYSPSKTSRGRKIGLNYQNTNGGNLRRIHPNVMCEMPFLKILK